MRNTTIPFIVLVCGLVVSSAEAQTPTLDLTITYPHFPAASGVYTFAFDTDQYLHNGLPNTFGTLTWDGPFTPQAATGKFVHADDGVLIRFSGIWYDDGFLVTSVPHPTVTVTGTLTPEPAMLSALGLVPLMLRRR